MLWANCNSGRISTSSWRFLLFLSKDLAAYAAALIESLPSYFCPEGLENSGLVTPISEGAYADGKLILHSVWPSDNSLWLIWNIIPTLEDTLNKELKSNWSSQKHCKLWGCLLQCSISWVQFSPTTYLEMLNQKVTKFQLVLQRELDLLNFDWQKKKWGKHSEVTGWIIRIFLKQADEEWLRLLRSFEAIHRSEETYVLLARIILPSVGRQHSNLLYASYICEIKMFPSVFQST